MKIKVEGMHCVGCENRIKKSLKELTDKDVEVNYKTGEVTIDDTNIDKIKEQIENLGFEVKEFK